MAHASIPVDLFNPGQVFGCLGLLEAAEVLLGDAHGGFDWGDGAATVFHIRAAGDDNPVEAVLRFLGSAVVHSMAPEGQPEKLTTAKWDVTTETAPLGMPFPFPAPDSPATLPAVLRSGVHELHIEHWGDATRRDNVKFWAGAGGYPGVGLLRDALSACGRKLRVAADDPFAVKAPQSSSFRLDWRRDYVPLGAGFSPNEHSNITPLGFPLVEVLAAVGLSHARPHRPSRADKLLYRYAALGGTALPLPLLRAGLGCAPLPFPARTFRMHLDWPGQENQARCITDVVEEPPS